MRFFNFLVLLIAAVLPVSGISAPNNYPTRPVTIIVPYPPGGTADTVVRIVAQQLTESLGQAVVIDNRAGGGGSIGWGAGARATPDGYTLVALDTSFAMAPSLISKLLFDPARDFAHVAALCTAPFVVLVPPVSPAKSVKEFVELAKARPGDLHYGTGGVGQSAHILAEWFSSLAGVRLTHVPYKGGAPSNLALMTNEVQMTIPVVTGGIPLVNSGKARALMVTSEKRVPQLPDVPSAPEAGLPGMVANNWFWIAAPAKTPPEVVELLGKAIAAAANHPATVRKFAEAGVSPMTTTPTQTAKLAADDARRWSSIIKTTGIKAE